MHPRGLDCSPQRQARDDPNHCGDRGCNPAGYSGRSDFNLPASFRISRSRWTLTTPFESSKRLSRKRLSSRAFTLALPATALGMRSCRVCGWEHVRELPTNGVLRSIAPGEFGPIVCAPTQVEATAMAIPSRVKLVFATSLPLYFRESLRQSGGQSSSRTKDGFVWLLVAHYAKPIDRLQGRQ